MPFGKIFNSLFGGKKKKTTRRTSRVTSSTPPPVVKTAPPVPEPIVEETKKETPPPVVEKAESVESTPPPKAEEPTVTEPPKKESAPISETTSTAKTAEPTPPVEEPKAEEAPAPPPVVSTPPPAPEPEPEPTPAPEPVADAVPIGDRILEEGKKYIGTPYVFGGTTPEGFDCSGFVGWVYEHVGIDLPRTSRQQAELGTKIDLESAKLGDLIFFSHTGNRVSHVGIVINKAGEPLTMIHASTSKGVIISGLATNTYWKPRITHAVRILD